MKTSGMRRLPVFWRASIAGLIGGAVGLALAASGLGLWGFVLAGALIAPFVGFLIDLTPRHNTGRSRLGRGSRRTTD
jgi:hypothetical protein